MTGRIRTSEKKARRELDSDLDKALAQTFPASDPFSVGQSTGTEPPSRPVDRKAPRLPVARRGRRKRRSAA